MGARVAYFSMIRSGRGLRDPLHVHASAIGARAETLASHNALLTRWTAYQVATEVLTHEVGPRVSPERSRAFERMAASALLLPEREGVLA